MREVISTTWPVCEMDNARCMASAEAASSPKLKLKPSTASRELQSRGSNLGSVKICSTHKGYQFDSCLGVICRSRDDLSMHDQLLIRGVLELA